jgi:hypothetical protein
MVPPRWAGYATLAQPPKPTRLDVGSHAPRGVAGGRPRSPPSNPRNPDGKANIESFLRDSFGREMTHKVRDEAIGEDRFACVQECEYPNGNRVPAQILCQQRDGRVAPEAWDA